MIAGIQGLRGGSQVVDISDSRVNAAERARKISRALEQCSEETRLVLRAACGMPIPIHGAPVVGHIMLMTPTFLKRWMSSRTRRNRERYLSTLLTNDSPPVKLWISEVRREAEKMLHHAVKEFNLQEAECTSGRLTQSQSWRNSQG